MNEASLWKQRFNDDGLLTEVYHYLARTTDRISALYTPDTILFERGFPKVWYRWTPCAVPSDQPGAAFADLDTPVCIKKATGRDISAQLVADAFVDLYCLLNDVARVTDGMVIAQYVFVTSSTNREVKVAYLDYKGLVALLSARADGVQAVLQSFVVGPRLSNTTMMVTAVTVHSETGPRCKVLLSQRSNVHQFHIPYSTSDQQRRCPTFDDTRLSEPSRTGPEMQKLVTEAVEQLVQSILRTERMGIKTISLQLKLDKRGRFAVLLCTSIRSVDPSEVLMDKQRNPIVLETRQINVHECNITVPHASKPREEARRSDVQRGSATVREGSVDGDDPPSPASETKASMPDDWGLVIDSSTRCALDAFLQDVAYHSSTFRPPHAHPRCSQMSHSARGGPGPMMGYEFTLPESLSSVLSDLAAAKAFADQLRLHMRVDHNDQHRSLYVFTVPQGTLLRPERLFSINGCNDL